jgi:hypothetical protein
MPWAQKRKIIYISIILISFVLLGLVAYFFLKPLPSCDDKKQNQDELGIDCGGICTDVCRNQILPPVILWARTLKVQEGLYNVLAYVQNPNLEASTKEAVYRFKIYDAKGDLIYERSGSTSISPSRTIAIFEPGLLTGASIPARTKFEFISDSGWVKDTASPNRLKIVNKQLSNETVSPKLIVTIANNTVEDISNIETVAIIYDENDNAIAFSRTWVDRINSNEQGLAVFTWPEPFAGQALRIEIITNEGAVKKSL